MRWKFKFTNKSTPKQPEENSRGDNVLQRLHVLDELARLCLLGNLRYDYYDYYQITLLNYSQATIRLQQKTCGNII